MTTNGKPVSAIHVDFKDGGRVTVSEETVLAVRPFRPAHRCVLVWAHAGHWDDGYRADVEILPVLALQSEIVRCPQWLPSVRTTALVIRRGELLWYDPGRMPEIENESARLVACTWPPDQDADALKRVLAEVTEDAIDGMRRLRGE
jgi:hypothetical protein